MKQTTYRENRAFAYRLGAVLLILMLVLLPLASCSADSAGDAPSFGAPGYDKNESMGEMGGMSGSTGVPSQDEMAGSSTDVSDNEYATKIIRTVTMRAETKQFEATITTLEALTSQYGGYIENSYVHGAGYEKGKGYSRSAEYTFRIPAEKLDEFLAETGELFAITYQNSTVSNVTSTYYDIVTRLETLRAEQASLQGMLEKAEDLNSMLSIKDRLYDVIYEIESYETQLRLLDTRVAYSTVTLNLIEVVEYTEIEDDDPTWGERLGDAFKDSWKAFAKGFENFTVFLVAALPTLLVLGVIVALIVLIIVKINKKSSGSKRQTPPAQGVYRVPPQNNDQNNQNSQK